VVGDLVRERRVALGLTQADLALRAGLRQTYISQVENGEIAMPRGHNLDALGGALGIAREEFYRAAGYFDGLPDDPDDPDEPAPRVVVVQGPAGETAVPLERVVAYVEHFPDERHQARLERWRARHDAATYTRLCARVYIAWSSNYELLLDTLDAVNSR
jgi:transcriptional regulator with XRE-family HTH domain